MDNPVHHIHTPCKKCVFAKYDGNTQKDCHLAYLDKYRASNIEIIEAYDNEKEFYIINDKKCIGYREDKWFDNLNLEDNSIETKINIYHQYNKLHYLVVVNLKNFDSDSLGDLLKQISHAEVLPQKIAMIRYRNSPYSFSYDKIEQLIKNYNINYQWRIQTMLDDSISYESVLHNTITINPKYRFIISISAPADNIDTLINKANTIVHKDLDQFMVLSNKEKTAVLFSGGVYRFGAVSGENILTNDEKYTIL